MDSYILFRGAKRLAVREDDMTITKIARLFQVQLSMCHSFAPSMNKQIHAKCKRLISRGYAIDLKINA